MELWGVVPILVFGVLYIGIIAGIIAVIVIVLIVFVSFLYCFPSSPRQCSVFLSKTKIIGTCQTEANGRQKKDDHLTVTFLSDD